MRMRLIGTLLGLDLTLLVSLIGGTDDKQPPLPQHEAAVNAQSPQRCSVLHSLSPLMNDDDCSNPKNKAAEKIVFLEHFHEHSLKVADDVIYKTADRALALAAVPRPWTRAIMASRATSTSSMPGRPVASDRQHRWMSSRSSGRQSGGIAGRLPAITSSDTLRKWRPQ